MNELNVTNNVQAKEEQPVILRDVLFFVIDKWYWFVLSVGVCLAVAVTYLMWTPKVYERTATVLIKDDKAGSGETALFQDLSIFEGKNNVNNEMIVFKSYSLMAEVVRRLKIDVSYTVKDGIRTQELYTNSPVTLTFMNLEETQRASLKTKLLPDKKAVLWDFKTNGFEDAQQMTVNLNDTVNTPIGRLIVTPTLWYDETGFEQTLTVTKSNFAQVTNDYRRTMTVGLADKQTSVVNLSLRDVSIQRAEDVLNTVIAVYNEDAINDKNIMAVNTEDFINERIIIIEQELGLVDTKITSFKTQHQLTDIQSDAQIALQESSEADRIVSALQSRRTMAEYIRTYLTNPGNSTEMIPSNAGIEDINVENQISTYNQTLLKRNRLKESSSERNPVVQDLNNNLNAMRQNITRAIDNLIVNLDIQLRSAKARTERTRARITAVPQQQSEETSIRREQKIKEELYLYLLNKREENALNKAIQENTARIIDAATGAANPVVPRTIPVIMAAFLLGLVLPATILYLLMLSDVTVRGRKDLVSVLSIPFLGEIPFKKMKGKSNAEDIAVRENGRDPISEAFRIIRTNMEFMRVKQDNLKVIMITSANAGSGKTFVASNISASLAMTGKKVMLIDMDIRKGTLGKRKDIDKKIDGVEIGLTNYLSKIIDNVDMLITQDKNYSNIDMISSGPEPPNPAELLLSPRLDELINRLREIYDYIVIDNVPCRMIADAFISNRVADLTLYVIRAGKMDRRMLPDIEQLYHDKKLKNMAILLNAVEAGIKYGYGYGYGNYSYGYGNAK